MKTNLLCPFFIEDMEKSYQNSDFKNKKKEKGLVGVFLRGFYYIFWTKYIKIKLWILLNSKVYIKIQRSDCDE